MSAFRSEQPVRAGLHSPGTGVGPPDLPTPPPLEDTPPRCERGKGHLRAPDPGRTTPRPSAGIVTPPPIGEPPLNSVLTLPGYEVGTELARGGMGVVYAAHDLSLDRPVAIKTLLPGLPAGAAARRFFEEARITARLPHPGVPPVYAAGLLPDGRPFMAMKLIRGRTLAAILAARDQRPSSHSSEDMDLTAPDVPGLLQVFEQIGQAVGFAHAQGIIHRDLKPQNVMVGAFGEVQVMDWGLAREQRAIKSGARVSGSDAGESSGFHPDQTREGETMGTPAYMPPEQARGEWERVDARADVFALGGILCAILTGRAPYTAATPAEVLQQATVADLNNAFDRLDRCGASTDLVTLAKTCLAADPAHRLADAGVVVAVLFAYRTAAAERVKEADRLRAALGGHVPAMAQPSPVERTDRLTGWRVAPSKGLATALLVGGSIGLGLIAALLARS